jgi:hypothetical protein
MEDAAAEVKRQIEDIERFVQVCLLIPKSDSVSSYCIQ